MENLTETERLSRIQTHWSAMLATGNSPKSPLHEILLRYYRAAFRYLQAMVRSPAVAEELVQEFAIRFLRGDFLSADPDRGRFRDYLKIALRNQVCDYWRRQQRDLKQHGSEMPDPSTPPTDLESETQFFQTWRDELLARSWEGLARMEDESGKPYCSALRLKTQQPSLRSNELAEQLAAMRGKPMTAESYRQIVHRAREAFAELLLDEVAQSLDPPPNSSPPNDAASLQRIEDELIELKMLDYCRRALDRRRSQSAST